MKIRIMKKTAFKFFAMLSLAMFFAGCNNFLNEIDDDKKAASSTKVTLKGSLALDGGASPSEFLAMVAGGLSRSAVTGGSVLGGYSFVLTATEVDTSSNANPASINATVTDNKFSITLDADKNYKFDLTLNSSDATSDITLAISKIVFGEQKVANLEKVNLKGLTKAEIEGTKVYFSPDTTIFGTGKIALEINTATETKDKVKYVKYLCDFEYENNSYRLNGDVSFDNNQKAVIEITKATQNDDDVETEIDLPNGIYDFTFEFYESNPDTNPNDSPVAVAYQKVNVFAGFVTDTWISDGSAWFSEVDGKTKFVVSDAAINAYNNPTEFYVNGYASDSSSWGDGSDSNAGTSIKKPFNTLQQAIDRVIAVNDETSEYKIYVKGTIYPKEYTEEKDGQTTTSYKMANFNALGTETPLKLSIVGAGSGATLSGKTSGDDTTATTYGSVVVIGDYDANAPENSTKIQNLNLSLENLTIRDGYVGTGWGGPGGGIFNNGATVALKDCNITENGAWKGSGIYSMNGTIITDNTTIKENIHDENSTGIQLDNSILKVKNTLTLYKNFIVIDGNSTITSDDESGATIKCGATPEEIQQYNPCGYGIYVSASAGDSEQNSIYATLSLSGSLAFEGFTTGVKLERKEIVDGDSLGYVNGHLTLDGEITNLSVELEDYGLITLRESYSTQSTISVNFSGSYNSTSVFINGCDAEKAATFIEVSDYNNEYYTVTEGGYLQAATLTQARFRTYCSELYNADNNAGTYGGKMTLEIPNGSNVMTGDDGVNDAYKYVTSIKIPDGYIAIVSNNNEGGVFSDCTTYLEEVTLPDSMVIIGDYAFNGCSALTSITIPNSVTSIGTYAFNSSGLTSITIPENVISIGDNAFNGCTNLTTVTMLSTTPPTLGTDVFPSYVCINVPASETTVDSGTKSYLEVYQEATNWRDYSNYLQVLLTKEEVAKIAPDYQTATIITIPESWGYTVIASDAFSECAALTTLTIPSSVLKIEARAFASCTSLNDVSLACWGTCWRITLEITLSWDSDEQKFSYVEGEETKYYTNEEIATFLKDTYANNDWEVGY